MVIQRSSVLFQRARNGLCQINLAKGREIFAKTIKTLDHFYHSLYMINKGAEILGRVLK